MHVLRQIFVILAFFLLGEVAAWAVSSLFPSVFIPGTVLGMVFLTVALATGVVKLRHVDAVGTFLTSNMAFFFIPAAVGVIEYFDLLGPALWKILVIVVVGAVASFLAILGAVRLTLRLMPKATSGGGDGHA